MVKYALFSYSTENIGDEIQSIAASRFLPQIDYYINRDYMNDFKPDTDEQIKLIMNGWYSHRPQNFPLKNEQITPLLISMFVTGRAKVPFSSEENVAFFKKYGPVGARSADTKEYMESLGVESYWSGCMTLTLQPEKYIKKQDFVLAIDLPEEACQKLEKESKLPVIRLSVYTNHKYMSDTRRMKLAKYYLYLYQSARLVVTTRLHATLPCLALGTSVLNIELPNFEPERFGSLRELSNHMTLDEFMSGTGDYDINNPKENPTEFLEARKNLEDRCQAFTGFKNKKGFLNGQPVAELLRDPELIQTFATGVASAYREYGTGF
ncbi:polysaccharide pyruvyl transferase family protein [Streptococcus suis]|uniref:polysaccharide pyruvyl transferase family protein n=2 Tax=Streptococcus suis TaxID=1307 RepID=UPI001551C606|nr:polysaccharide pyruvyl transferase family protein [Streptococcus suis]NQK40614.1 polysaccharide pyruvyl transferase family protein [Streptococcus suis]NQM31302.1 polysaccharide pyruvyl transferase family protein [Streptococcus suis]HEL2310123.1 polysaccharide pyruvyl transferase family protein [Streptococcus suis]HEM2829676.1 polysaccharide pyruvyl transferase family protein [Streptococcus suis]